MFSQELQEMLCPERIFTEGEDEQWALAMKLVGIEFFDGDASPVTQFWFLAYEDNFPHEN
tara:strand:+ start:892 stop:1071 length:180 start_codon:yes stop_codon:yes gene_type:complete